MNGFEQIKAFYSWVFNHPDKARPTHISLYLFLWNQANRAMWVEWFKCPYDLAMQGACIGNKGTYYRCLDELQNWKLIEYKKGINLSKAPMIKLIQLYGNEPLSGQVTVPLSEPQGVPLSVLLHGNIYKLITNNIQLVSVNLEKWIQTQKLIDLEKPTDFVSLQDYEDYREYIFSKLDESFKQELKENVGIDRPYVWVNRKISCEYFDLVDCLVKAQEDVEWRASIQQNNNITKEYFEKRLYEFVKTIKDSKEYLGYHGYDASDGKDNFITHFSRWLRVKLNFKVTEANKKGSSSVGVGDF